MSKHALRSRRNHRFGILGARNASQSILGCRWLQSSGDARGHDQGGPNLLFARDRTPSSDALSGSQT